MTSDLPKISVAEMLAEKIAALKPGALPAATARKCEDLLIDVVGLCVTARNEDYVGSALAGCDDDGPCTAIGHRRTLNAAGAAFVNGTAAHGEDFDDTFEGGPVHAGAVIVPAVLAACERHHPDGRMALVGIAVGTEVLCRLSLVVPKAVHKAGFHPTAIFGAIGAAAGVGLGVLGSLYLVHHGIEVGAKSVAQLPIPIGAVMYGRLTLAGVGRGLLLGLVTAILGALWPAWKASALSPVEATDGNA